MEGNGHQPPMARTMGFDVTFIDGDKQHVEASQMDVLLTIVQFRRGQHVLMVVPFTALRSVAVVYAEEAAR